MVSKKQAVFGQQVQRAMALKKVKQRQIAAYLGIAPSSVSRKYNGLHPWTADEQAALIRFLNLEVVPAEESHCRDDPALEAVDQLILGMPRQERPDVYKTVALVAKGKQHTLTPSGQEAYRALCALVG